MFSKPIFKIGWEGDGKRRGKKVIYLYHSTISGYWTSVHCFLQSFLCISAHPTHCVVCTVASCCLLFPLLLYRASPSHTELVDLPRHVSFWLVIAQGHSAPWCWHFFLHSFSPFLPSPLSFLSVYLMSTFPCEIFSFLVKVHFLAKLHFLMLNIFIYIFPSHSCSRVWADFFWQV